MMKKVIKILLLIIFAIVIFIVGAFVSLTLIVNYQNANYYKLAKPQGEIEKKYTPLGSYDVSYTEASAENDTYKKYEIWYPAAMSTNQDTYPVVIMANGTGVKASRYKEVFKHLSSWGFIVAGNEDENSRTGASSEATLEYLITQNSDSNSIFYHKLDLEHIGIGGHSQGGVGAVNAVTQQKNGNMYKALFTASITSTALASADVLGAEWVYDISKVTIPCFMVAGTKHADAGTAADKNATEGQGISPLWSMTANYNALPDTVDKVMARMVNKDHGDMLRGADAYMTAWFMYYLKDVKNVENCFYGNNAEIMTNTLYQDQKSNQHVQ